MHKLFSVMGLLLVTIASPMVAYSAEATNVSVFPPSNLSECNDDTALTWNGRGSVRCDLVVKVSPTLGSPLYGFSVAVRSPQGMYDTIESFLRISMPQPLSAADAANAEQWRNECRIDNSADAAEIHAIASSPTCRNIICSMSDSAHRWPVNTSHTGTCLQGAVSSACPTGQMMIRVGCMFTSQSDELRTIP